MLQRAKNLFGFTLHAIDGEIGKIRDFYFDDQQWQIRYLIVDVGSWLFGRRVLLAPAVAEKLRWDTHELLVQLTKEQVANSPDIDLEKPVGRQHEIELSQYYGWPMYWSGSPPLYGAVGGLAEGAWPVMTLAEQQAAENTSAASDVQDDAHLRSIQALIGYVIQATDGEIGHLKDFLIDADDWTISYLLVDTGHWLSGKQVLLETAAIGNIDWYQAKVYVKRNSAQIHNSPAYDPNPSLALDHPARAEEKELEPAELGDRSPTAH